MTAEEFKQWRVDHNYTQAQLAEVLEVTEMTVYRWETGKAPIAKTVELALDSLDCRGVNSV